MSESKRRTFVVWLDGDVPAGQLRGRAEHVPSGDRRTFDGLEELAAFLTTHVSRPPGEGEEPTAEDDDRSR
jgi:hypothetical protein